MSKDADGNFTVRCTVCKTPFKVYPPGLEYVRIIQQPCTRGDSIATDRTCPACDTQNTIIWDIEHK